MSGSKGQPRPHPALTELRGTRLVLGRLLAQLALPAPDAEPVPSPATLRARKAARTHWDRTAELRAWRRDRGQVS